jgi:hypothetical protein
VREVLQMCHEKGIELRADLDSNRIGYRPKGLVDLELARAIHDNHDLLLATLCQDDLEVTWRVQAMSRQIPEHGGIPLLIARPGEVEIAPAAPGEDWQCHSCGLPKEQGQRYICRRCQIAKWVALRQVHLPVAVRSQEAS